FRTYGSAQFQALAAFCRLSKASIDQSITYFYQSTLLSPQVLSENVFQSQIRESINQFQITASNTFKSQLRLINEMIIHNQLVSALMTNFIYYQKYSYSDGILQQVHSLYYSQSDSSRCDCRTDFCGKIPSLIVDVFGASSSVVSGNIRWSILGMSSGCLPVTSMLVSTLECFYNQTCVNKLISYFLTIESFTAMIYNNQSVYNQNSTIESIIDNLMIEDWMINISYDNYYSECAPASCTYINISRHDFVYVLIKLISVLSGLILVLRFAALIIIQFMQNMRNGATRQRIPWRVRLHQFIVLIRKIIIELNIFEHYPNTDRQIRFQRYGTRLYIFLLFNSLAVLITLTFLKSSIQSKTILHPTQSQFIQLQQDYPQTLSCPCTEISMNYSTFITIQPHYHQLCSSDLISDKWIEYIVGSISDDGVYYTNDYRVTGYSQFQLLTMFCQQAQQAIDDALRVFLQTTFISSQVLTQQSFQVQINSVIETWKLTTV
ncbi:unnamed protein product, partial [Adineta steineri]